MKRRKIERILNELVDSIAHPYFSKDPTSIIVDGLLHAMIEQDPEKSLRKFVKYNGPKLLNCFIGKKRHRKRK